MVLGREKVTTMCLDSIRSTRPLIVVVQRLHDPRNRFRDVPPFISNGGTICKTQVNRLFPAKEEKRRRRINHALPWVS